MEAHDTVDIEKDQDTTVIGQEINSISKTQDDSRYHFDPNDLDKVQRRLKQRHIQMIAIAGTIGTGLFLGSGSALSGGGPLGALIAYALVATVAYSSLCSIGEMTTHAPISGAFPYYAARWVDPALGFAIGWNYFYSSCMGAPVEVTAATILITFWDTNPSHRAGYTAALCVVMCAINIFGVRYFGEAEFVFSVIKITMIIVLILVGLIIDLGGGPDHNRIGFQYWRNPGPVARAGLVKDLNTDRFIAFLSVIVQAAFSLQGMELVTIAASETENPRRNIAKAVRRVFWRILIFYILGILIIGMNVPYNDDELLRTTGNAAQSPFVIAISRSGIKVLPHIINAGIFTSAISAGNSFLFCASRILYGLALRGQAPKFLTYCTKKGLPLSAMLTSSSLILLSFMNISNGPETVFNWFVRLSTTAGFISWFTINLTYIFFHRGMTAQGFDLRKNVYNNRFQPYIAYWGLGGTIFFTLVTGFEVFFNFNVAGFLTAYINIAIFLTLFLGYKLIKRTKTWKPLDMDFVTGIPPPEETDSPEAKPVTISEKIAAALF